MTARPRRTLLQRAARGLKWAAQVFVDLKTRRLTPTVIAEAGGTLKLLTAELDELEAIPTVDRALADTLRHARSQVAESAALLERARRIRTLPSCN